MIYVECNPDYVLLKLLGVYRKDINHVRGIGRLCGKLGNTIHSKGLIDEDPNKTHPSYIEELRPDNMFLHYGIKILHDKKRDNTLFVLCPRLENWILEAAKESNIKHSLPDDWSELHKKISKERMKTSIMKNWETLISDLKRKSTRMKTLAKLVEG